MTVGEMESVLTNICMNGLSNAKIKFEYVADAGFFDEGKNPKMDISEVDGEHFVTLYIYQED